MQHPLQQDIQHNEASTFQSLQLHADSRLDKLWATFSPEEVILYMRMRMQIDLASTV